MDTPQEISNRDIILLYAYDLAKTSPEDEPWQHPSNLPMRGWIRQVEAREILKKYGRNANPGTVHKILMSHYFRRMGTNIRSPFVPSSDGWEIVRNYIDIQVDGRRIGDIWKEKNIVDGKLKDFSERELLLDIVISSISSEDEEVEEKEEVEDETGDFVEYILTGIKYRDMGLMREAYEMFEKALESNTVLMEIPRQMSVILGSQGFYREALRMREEYWKRFDESLLHEHRELERHLSGEVVGTYEKLRYAVLEGDISSCVKYFEDLADELKNSTFSGAGRLATLSRRYAEELKKLL